MFGDCEQMRKDIHKQAGGPVVVVYRNGGRIREEMRYDSESNSPEALWAVKNVLFLGCDGGRKIGPESIGNGYVGTLPWEFKDLEKNWKRMELEGATEEERLSWHAPIRVQDIVKNAQTGITTIYLESV